MVMVFFTLAAMRRRLHSVEFTGMEGFPGIPWGPCIFNGSQDVRRMIITEITMIMGRFPWNCRDPWVISEDIVMFEAWGSPESRPSPTIPVDSCGNQVIPVGL